MYPLQRFFHKVTILFLSLLITVAVFGCFAYLYLDSQLPDVESLKSMPSPTPLRVYTSDGQLIAEFGALHSTPVTFNEVPPLLIKALLATEDQRFYEHSGVDMLGLIRAVGQLVMTGTKSQGGSTITMQVARNFYLTRKKTFSRKLTEILLALKIEREFTKDQILELYLNKIYLGNRAYGVAAAAQVYYGKPLNQLTLPELAVIAGLPKAPSTINPIVNPIGAKDRRDHVLERMYEEGFINKQAYQAAVKTPLTAAFHGAVIPVHAPYVAEMVRNMMVTSFGEDAYTKGYSVYTTINSKQQLAANQALRDAIIAYDHRHGYRGAEGNLGIPDPSKTRTWADTLARIPTVNGLRAAAVTDVGNGSVTALISDGTLITIPWEGLVWAKPQLKNGWTGATPRNAANIVEPGDIIRVDNVNNSWQLAQIPQVQGAFVALNPNNGGINALVGGFDFQRSKYNRVVQSELQPGSGFKPFVYASGLARGFTLASVFSDSPISFYIPGQAEPWRPQNDDHTFNGPTRLRYALAKSRNVIAVRLLQAVGIQYALNYVSRFGFNSKQLPRNLSMVLGTGEVTPLELVRGYAVFANGGYLVTPYVIDHINDSKNVLIYQSAPKIACTTCITGETPKNATTDNKGNQYAPQTIPPQIAFLITSVLQDVIHYGTGTAAKVLNRQDIAGKTGTTSEQIDAWFSGFNSDIVATAWVGFDTPSPLHEYGAQAALPMWIDFMRVALAGVPEHTMPEPEGIVSANVDPRTGYRLRSGVPEYFRSDDVPEEEAEPPSDDTSGNPNNPATGNKATGAPDTPSKYQIDSNPPDKLDPNQAPPDNYQNHGDPLF